MKILIVGSGGREHALGEKIKSSDRKLYFAPGNAGTSEIGENIDIKATDIEKLVEFAKEEEIDYTIVGPEDPLCMGLVDRFQENDLRVFGVNKKASKFESSKSYCKNFLEKYKIKTSAYLRSEDKEEILTYGEKLIKEKGKLVLKRDGLAGGKGVYIIDKISEFREKATEILAMDKFLIIEEFIDGFEMSLLALTDSSTIIPLPTAKDHKKIYDREIGPNTGGMGTYAPNVEAEAFKEKISEDILPKILEGFNKENIDYRGVLFIGFMINESGIYVLEFNVRFGDPETQVVLELIDNDILDLLMKTSSKKLDQVKLEINDKKAVCLVLASEGYPLSYEVSKEIRFDEGIKSKIIHAGTRKEEGKILTAGGRVLNILSVSDSFDDAIARAYEDSEKIHFDGKYYRKDIGPSVKRVYVKKKDAYDFESKNLREKIQNSLGINLESIKIYKRYDLETKDENIEKLLYTVLAEAPVDSAYAFDDALNLQKNFKNTIVSEYLPGQFNQREQGLIDTASLVIDDPNLLVRAATVYEISGVSPEDLVKIEEFIINPVDSHRVNLLGIPTSLKLSHEKNLENISYDGFRDFDDDKLRDFIEEYSLAMSLDDLRMVREYFISENRDPNETEIKILDTYWSDHCRHTTFNTYLDINIEAKTLLDEAVKESFNKYLKMRDELGIKKPINLMSFGTILSKYMRANDNFDDLEISKEINACSVFTKVRVLKDGKESLEDYLLMFKNETHNHPTEIEPFGGASTCLGGAIRDPLSGRSYVYQAMRLSGAGNIKEAYEDTLEGKLSQAKITKEAALGYSSYGNQIGLATGLVDEFYHEGYTAKRMECGAVIAAAPAENVKRLDPVPGDLVILLGGRTGRDGIGGATGSSKSHKITSIQTESAQVQKGNAPEERKIQRLFRRGEVASLIKKCNDFGAGGVSVAIGELADGIDIYLDKVPLKYEGLKPFEIAISESQERMAVVIDKKDLDEFMTYAKEENLEATLVARVTDNNTMTLYYGDDTVAKLSYDFINTDGAERFAKVSYISEDKPDLLKEKDDDPNKFYEKIKDLDRLSKRNLIEMFDSSIGRNTVLSPLGGRKLLNPAQVMAARIPVDRGVSKTVSLMTYGFDPKLSSESQYLGGYYAVVESIGRLVAVGSDLEKIRLSFQEFYESMDSDKAWSKPLKSLLGAFEVSSFFETPPIGGKDSMSGSFEDLKVPPSLISFAVTTEDIENIITNDFKGCGRIGLIRTSYKKDGSLNLEELKENFQNLNKDIREGNLISAISLSRKGLLTDLYEQSIGNTGFTIDYDNLYNPMFGSFLVEYKDDRDFIENIGIFSEDIIVNGVKLDKEKLEDSYLHGLDEIFQGYENTSHEKLSPSKLTRRLKSKNHVSKPKVTILAAPGTNCELDSEKAFRKAGADTEILVFRNQNESEIKESIDKLAELIKESQIFMIPGGFSLGDEPDGSAKFLANIIRNEKISKAIDYLLNENDGLIIGICNGFQALVKTGLLPYGRVKIQEETDPTLTFNRSSRHIASFVNTRCLTNNSPWTVGIDLDKIYRVPISHGEGRFIVNKEKLEELLDNDQIFSVYETSPNGSNYNIEGILSKDGKILGRMAHAERVDDDLFKNVYEVERELLFENAVNYFRKEEK
ncbi:Phosphoribosylamine--glycine ligase [Anaerococcus prevotii]|uniref:Phosphoribosylamine--glycine ligase n=1 Tax=Anaerococcus prevotii (strain ATCC 9321 / DSM 20548 / JCM 6508 / NCTC 11806 / PC1) TaxID=525919 RepID=C7RD71_ANAPD|nr:phosphoribosylformylglycinamidine synthase [Anaerococcus prevotii]ACV29134.1 phosphoribosylformylglycinamidine synthase [Anaerococcus prevotii DSM 20548]SUU94808.1 Phosphoribosylamine--glycine ligase [Anaerococcus prevotii]